MRNYHSSKIDLTCRCHFGGGAKTPPAPPAMPKFEAPPLPPAPPPPPPPPEAQTMGANDAADMQRAAAAKRSGFRKSILAGETGGYVNPATGANSLLG
jgi:hypothetical protein